MSQERMHGLALMSIERDETDKTNFNAIIDEFPSIKACEVLFQ